MPLTDWSGRFAKKSHALPVLKNGSADSDIRRVVIFTTEIKSGDLP